MLMKSGRLLALVLLFVPACYAQLDFTSIFGLRHSAGLAPAAFEPETAAATSFVSQAEGYSVRVDSGEIRVSFAREADTQPEAVRIILEGAGSGFALPSDPLPGVIHYYPGADPSQWRTDVRRYRQVRFRDVYPGIDLIVQSDGKDCHLEFDFEVAPGGRVRDISLRVEGANVRNSRGDLELTTPAGRVFSLQKPNLYQLRAGRRQPVSGGYVLRGAHRAAFVTGHYDPHLALVIDPALIYSTLVQNLLNFSSGNAVENDIATAVAVDSTGAAYITGFVNETAYVLKLDPTGSTMVYKTFLAGASRGNAIAVDAAGNAYIVGTVESSSFPVTPGAFSSTSACGGAIIFGSCFEPFATKLDPTGKIVYSTFLVQPNVVANAGPVPSSIAVDATGALFIGGELDDPTILHITPATMPGLTTTAGAFQATNKTPNSMFAMKLHADGSSVDYATYIGGSTAEQFGGLAIDSTGVAYITGGTTSTDFPTTPGAFQTQNPGPASAVFLKLKNDGTGLLYSTYLGAAGIHSRGFSIALDASNAAYLSGETDGPGFPTTSGVFRPTVLGPAPGPDGSGRTFNYTFVSKFDAAGALAFSTYLGEVAFLPIASSDFNASVEFPRQSIAVDASGAYLVESTASPTFPVLGTLSPPFGVSTVLTKLNLTGTALVYSTFFGSDKVPTEPGPASLAIDGAQNVYLAAQAFAFFPNMAMAPTTVGAFQTEPLFFGINQPAGFVVAKLAPSLGAPVPVLIPRLVNFDVLMADTLKAPPYPVQLSNFGDASLTPGAVSMSGPNAADFTPSSACNAAIPGGGECVINVAFAYNTAPSGSPRSATMTVGLGGLPSQTVALTAPAGAPAIHMFEDQGINFLPVTTVDFGAVALGSQATIDLSPFNQGSAPAILQQASLTGDFSATPVITTPLLLQPGGPPSAPVFIPHFSFAVTFKPTAAGARSGQFVLTEAALNGSHIVQLTGTGVTDFSLSADPDSNQVSVLQGGSAIATMHLSAAQGFTGSVSFSCSGLPAGASCSASPASFSFSGAGGTQNISVTLSTTGSSAALPGAPFHRKPLNRNAGLWSWAAAPVFGLLLVAGRPNKRRTNKPPISRMRVVRGLLALSLLVMGTLLVSCGGGGGTSHGPSGTTPPGTYSITVTATSGSTSRSAVVVLVVR
jgi:hypothetical protein